MLRTGMSWIRLDEPVAFGHETNDPVTLVAGLAATDASAHQNVLAALASALADPNRRNALDTATTPQEVVSILSNEAGHRSAEASTSQNLLLTVCGNGLGTSLFLKKTPLSKSLMLGRGPLTCQLRQPTPSLQEALQRSRRHFDVGSHCSNSR
ncbi:phosphotransferase system protein [Cutibacterium acnes JCM 18918]|nr:phosphotransferase system protein [Cutibacterium acnes JCM 18918]